MTSNIGSDVIQAMAGEDQYLAMRTKVLNDLALHFKPEFINRVDESVVFHPLLAEQIKEIAKIQLNALAIRLSFQDLNLVIDEEALSLIAKEGFDPLFGARPLQRVIQQTIENPLAQKLLASTFTKGSNVNIKVVAGQLAFIES